MSFLLEVLRVNHKVKGILYAASVGFSQQLFSSAHPASSWYIRALWNIVQFCVHLKVLLFFPIKISQLPFQTKVIHPTGHCSWVGVLEVGEGNGKRCATRPLRDGPSPTRPPSASGLFHSTYTWTPASLPQLLLLL